MAGRGCSWRQQGGNEVTWTVTPPPRHTGATPTSKSSGQLLLLLLLFRFSRLSRFLSSWGGDLPHLPAPGVSSLSISSTWGEGPRWAFGPLDSDCFFASFSQSPGPPWGGLAGLCASSAGRAASSVRASFSRSSSWTKLPISSLGECRRGSESRRKQQEREGLPPPGALLPGIAGWAASSKQGSRASGVSSRVSGKKSPDPTRSSAGCWRQLSVCWRHSLLCLCLLREEGQRKVIRGQCPEASGKMGRG